MLKKILAGASSLGFLALVHAQSTSTVFGVVDTGIGSARGSLTSVLRMNGIGGMWGSRLGFRGVEDLGGGAYAGYWLEAGINGDDGTGQASNANNQVGGSQTPAGINFNRRSTISVGGSWGELRAGRNIVSHYWNLLDADPFFNAGVGGVQTLYGSIGGITAMRASNSVTYLAPNSLGGFFGEVMYFVGENVRPSQNKDDGSGVSYRIGYASGPWKVAFASGLTRYLTTATNGDTRVANAVLTYDAGFARVMAGVSHDKLEKLVPITANGWSLAGVVPVGAGEIKTSFSRYGTNAAGSPSASKFALGYVYNLSKRTALYASAASVKNKGGSTQAIPGSTTEPNRSSSGWDLGMRHVF